MNNELLKIILQSCTPGILCFVFLTIFISFDKTFKTPVLRKFFLAIFSSFILLVSDVIDYYFHMTGYYHQFWSLIAAISFTFRIASLGFLTSIVNRKSERYHKIIYGLIIFNCLIAFLTIKFGFYVTFDENYDWHTGPLFFMPYVISAFFEYVIIRSIVENFKENTTEATMIVAFTIACIIANILELLKLQRIALAQTIHICIIFYYLCLNVQLYRLDALTSLMNRRCLYSDLKRLSSNKLILVSMNINNLEEINKLNGYREGDNVVMECAKMMSDSFKSHALVYRANGDEFIAVFKNQTLDLAMECVSSLQKKMKKTEYKIAIGYTEYFPGKDIEESIYIAREKMHENKELIKKDEFKF